MTAGVPGIAARVDGGRSFVLDGELVAAAGRASDFHALAPRLAGSPLRASTSISFWAFDLLWIEGELLVDLPYADRRAALEQVHLAGPLRCRSQVSRYRYSRSSRCLRRPRRRGASC
jgi:bifunctional non-homologous end joining protein LigD